MHFRREDITDWVYQRNGKLFGAFTACVMLKHMDREDAARIRADGYQCQP
jgi:uncharacterized protein YegJ (DUF2314 family)